MLRTEAHKFFREHHPTVEYRPKVPKREKNGTNLDLSNDHQKRPHVPSSLNILTACLEGDWDLILSETITTGISSFRIWKYSTVPNVRHRLHSELRAWCCKWLKITIKRYVFCSYDNLSCTMKNHQPKTFRNASTKSSNTTDMTKKLTCTITCQTKKPLHQETPLTTCVLIESSHEDNQKVDHH